MNKYLILGQGSQTIQLIRELFAIGSRPDELEVFTIEDEKNQSFNSFVDYYQIKKTYVDKKNTNVSLKHKLCNSSPRIKLVISFSNPFIIQQKCPHPQCLNIPICGPTIHKD